MSKSQAGSSAKRATNPGASPAKLKLGSIPEEGPLEEKADVRPAGAAVKEPKPAPKPAQRKGKQLPPSDKGLVELIEPDGAPSDSDNGGSSEAMLGSRRTPSEASSRSDAMLGAGFVCPTYLSDQFGKDGAWTNADYDAQGWTRKCLRGKAYSSTGNAPSTNVKEAMKLARELRFLTGVMRWSKLKEEEKYTIITLSKLNSAAADIILRTMWDYEFNTASIRQIYLALLPVYEHRHDEDLDKMSKYAMIDSLVRAHVPFVFFDWMELFAAELRDKSFVQGTSCSDARLHFLETFVFCSDERFLALEKRILAVDDDTSSPLPDGGDTPADPEDNLEVPKTEDAPARRRYRAAAREDSDEPGGHSRRSRKKSSSSASKRRRSVSPRSPSSHSCGATPSPSRSPDSRRGSKMSKRSKSRMSRSRGRRRSSSDDRGKRSSGTKHTRKSRSASPSERSTSRSSSSSSSRSRSRHGKRSRSRRSRSADGVQGLAKVLKSFMKAQKSETKAVKSRIEKHLARLDEGLRSGTYIDPCAYSSAHLVNVEMKGSSAKDSLSMHNGRLVTDENAAEDVVGAPSSICALKEGLHFIAQRLMTEAEFKNDTARVADRYKFIAYIEADFAGAQPDRKVPVLKEFIRRVSKKRFWCPEIPIQSALFFQAFTAPAQKVVHVDDDGEQIRRPTKNRNRDRSNRGGERGRGRGRGRGGGGGGGGGGDKSNKNTFTQDERKRCGPCPSRMTKDGVCPSDAAGTPWTCKFDHNCPRCPSKSHRAKFCKLCQV